MLLELNQLIVPAGHQLLIKNISWLAYKHILAELGENRSSRISYSQGVLEIMAPLSEHEVAKVIIGDLVKIILEELDIEFWSLGSTTFDQEKMEAGIEPDDCFYIQNEVAVRGKDRIDLTIDPPGVRRRLESLSPQDIAICSVVKAELFYGARRSKNPQRTLAVQSAFLNNFVSLPFDDAAATIFGNIRAELATNGTPIGPYDLQIVSIAQAHNLILVTHNISEFSRVSGLQIEDWEETG